MIKCLIWDLDDTLWQGILRENWAVTFAEERRRLIIALDEMGILQSIASRNDPELVNKKLEELGIKQYFLYPQCHFGSKVDSIKAIAKALNIGVDAVGYIDDNPFELFEVQYFLPEVHTFKAEEDQQMLEYPEFQSGKITKEASERRQMMLARQEREHAEQRFTGSREAFLKECRMELMIRPAQDADADRIYELAARTNQLNNMKELIDEGTILDFIHDENKTIVVTELTDRFGEQGIVGVCFLEMESTVAFIRLFCISCRIEGRGVGVAFLGEVFDRLQAGYPAVNEIFCPFKSSERNRPALLLLKMLGFKRKEQREEYSFYSLPLPHPLEKVEWIQIKYGL